MIVSLREKVNFGRQKLKAMQDRHKSYANMRRKEIEFKVWDSVYLKVSLTMGTMRFNFSRKLKHRYIGPSDMLATVGDLTYELALPPSLYKVHSVFRIAMLKKNIRDESHTIPNYMKLNIQPDATYEEEPIKILDKQDKIIRRKVRSLVKVIWNKRGNEETSCEKEDIKKEYPHLF